MHASTWCTLVFHSRKQPSLAETLAGDIYQNTDALISTRERPVLMTIPANHQPPSQSAQHPEFSLERISRLVSDLEQELANAPPDIPNMRELREEIKTLKHVLVSPEEKDSGIEERLQEIRGAFRDMTARVEGEVLKDSPYIAEIGRILGMI